MADPLAVLQTQQQMLLNDIFNLRQRKSRLVNKQSDLAAQIQALANETFTAERALDALNAKIYAAKYNVTLD
jgi:hypothetical protein